MQFAWLTPAEAAAYIRRAEPMAENHGDRIAARRRLRPVTTAEERAAARAYTERAALERFQMQLRGVWPAHGPIIRRRDEGSHG